MIRCAECGHDAAADCEDSAGLVLALHEGALEARSPGRSREAVVESGGSGVDLLLGNEAVPVPVGSRIQLGPFTLLVEQRRPAVPRQRTDAAHVLGSLEKDAAAALDAMAVADGGFGGPHAEAIEAVAQAVRAYACGDRPLTDESSAGRMAVLNLVEGIGDEMAGPGRSVRLPRGARTTAAAMVGVGPSVFLALALPTGPETVVLNRDGFSFVSAVNCRRLTSSTRGVEWRYTDPAPARGFDLSMQRVVAAIPTGVNGLLEEAWQHRLLSMVSRAA